MHRISGYRDGGYPRDSNGVCALLDKTYVASNYLKDIMNVQMQRNIHNIETVYIGVDEKQFCPDAVEKSSYPEKKIILFACRIIALKRPIFVVELAKLMVAKRKDLLFFIVR